MASMGKLFKEHRIIKLGIVFLLLGAFFLNNLSREQVYEQIDGFVYQPSYCIGDQAVFSMIGKSDDVSTVHISSLTNEFQTSFEIPSFKTTENDSVLFYGIQDYSSNIYNTKGLESGIYLINDMIPFIIKDTLKKADIVIVYPYVNNLIATPYGGRSIASEKITFTNLYRANYVDSISVEMRSFFKEMSENYSVKYISDIDLEDSRNIAGAKLVIFYGDLLYATNKMRKSVLSYLENGGDVLLASTRFFNNLLWLDSKQPQMIVLNKKARDKGIYSQDRYSSSVWEIERKYINEYIGFTHVNGGLAVVNEGYEIILEDSPIFNHLQIGIVPVLGQRYMGIDGVKENNHFRYNLSNNFTVKTHAYLLTESGGKPGMSGIIELKISDRSGVILSLGTNQWFASWNYGKSKHIRNITHDAVTYLLSD